VIRKIKDNQDGTFLLKGLQLNGISEGASYGDDAEMYSNYPIIRLTDANGNVFYTRTYNWSSTGVASGRLKETVDFTLPPGIQAGDYSLQVIGCGIASNPVTFTVTVPDAVAASGRGGASQVVAGLLPVTATTAAALAPGSDTVRPDEQVVPAAIAVASSQQDQGARTVILAGSTDGAVPIAPVTDPLLDQVPDPLLAPASTGRLA
jgi:hypothetical protein